jgi:hypothetical protein
MHGCYPFLYNQYPSYKGGRIGLIIAQPEYFTVEVWDINIFLIDVLSCPCYDAKD